MAIKVKLKVVDKDLGYKKWISEMKKVAKGKPSVQVGVLGDSKGQVDEEVLIIALVHEFGSPSKNIPSRSWLRGACDEYQAKWGALRLRLLKLIDKGKLTVEEALNIIGQQAVTDIKAHIRARIPPALQPETIRRKGSDIPLIDTARFINAITYQVNMGGRRA